MKIAFFISEDYAFTYPLLENTIPSLEKKHTLEGIVQFPDTLIGLMGMEIPLKYLEIFGYLSTMRLAVQSIINKCHIYLNVVKKKTPFTSFEQMAHHKNIPYLKYSSPNDIQVINWVKEKKVDVIFIFFGHILQKEIISAPRCCIINKHASLLPANRGVLPVFWAMLKDENVGFSLHKVTEKLDSGEVLFQKVYNKQPLTLYEWYQVIYADGPTAIMEVMETLDNGTIPVVTSNISATPSYNSLPTKDEVKKFYKKGLKII
jgi:methionyl-tRNA formyltransferase